MWDQIDGPTLIATVIGGVSVAVVLGLWRLLSSMMRKRKPITWYLASEMEAEFPSVSDNSLTPTVALSEIVLENRTSTKIERAEILLTGLPEKIQTDPVKRIDVEEVQDRTILAVSDIQGREVVRVKLQRQHFLRVTEVRVFGSRMPEVFQGKIVDRDSIVIRPPLAIILQGMLIGIIVVALVSLGQFLTDYLGAQK